MSAVNVRRKAIWGRCGKCRAEIITGPDANLAAINAQADAVDLSARGELLAVIARREVYELDNADRLHHRTAKAIIFGPVARSSSLHPAHTCEPVPANWRAAAGLTSKVVLGC